MSAPSESFTRTVDPSFRVSAGSPPLEGLGWYPEASLDLPREVRGVAECRVDLLRLAGLHETHHVLEVPVVAQGELGVEAVPAREVEEGGPSGDVRAPQTEASEP